MALTPEQENQLEYMRAQQELSQAALKSEREHNLEMEKIRNGSGVLLEKQRARFESVRLAKEVLIENARSKPVDSRQITADDIKNYSETLLNYINE